jgi:serine/threonine-protein kinase RsbW
MKASLNVPGTLDALDEINQYVIQSATAAGLDKTTSYRLRLAVDEIVTNIVRYGYEQAGTSGEILVTAEISPECLIITTRDSGIEFDPHDAPPPDHPETPLEFRKIGGWGVHFAIHAVDEFKYERVGNFNHNIFMVKRPQN